MKNNVNVKIQKKAIILTLAVLIVLCGVAAGILLQRLGNVEPVVEGNKANVAWYNESEETFTISTVEELYELAALSDFYDFEGQTILLGADIVVNEGNAADWALEPPENRWFPIQGFAGTFDGQGHTISGMYGMGISTPMGLFSDTSADCKIRDFKLVNSYFYVDGSQGVGSIASKGSGSFEKIYSDAIVASNHFYAGGLIGRIDSGRGSSVIASASKLVDCWFDGEVNLISSKSRMGGGFVGAIANGNVKMEHCLSSGTINCPEEQLPWRVGGFSGAVGVIEMASSKATLHMNDCLHVGDINSDYKITAGSFIGNIAKSGSTVIKSSYTEKSEYNACDVASGPLNGAILEMKSKQLIGQEAYRWTELDFEKHWSAVQEKTPELTCFADNAMSLAGVAKAYNIDWYDEEAKEYVIDTVEELYGLQMLCNQKNTFAGKTIKLGADIIVNTGKATDWAKGKNLPELEWVAIGGGGNQYMPFAGTFDGQGHTISGLYTKSDSYMLGLFGVLSGDGSATVKNLKLLNSYFEGTRTDQQVGQVDGLGSIVGQGAGTLDTIYSDAILVNGTSRTGGLIGNVRQKDAPLTVVNCWFNGSITGTDWIGGIVGFAHGSTKYTNLKDCLVTADLTSTMKEGKAFIGGLSGRATAGTITSCLVVGDLTGPQLVSGFVGLNVCTEGELSITQCYNATNVTKMFEIGAGKTFSLMLKNVDKEDIKGTGGYVNTLLSFYEKGKNKDGRWVAVKDKTPQLKSFTKTGTLSVSGLARSILEVDVSWYDASKKTYSISNTKQLYGLAELCNAGIDFAGKTIKLSADIQVNAGKATDWAKGENLPMYAWTPIGGGVTSTDYIPFAGTFDGQGHTISGLYLKSDGYYLGLFGALAMDGSSTIKNLKLTNSYFECTRTEAQIGEVDGLGSIAGQAAGKFDTIYSDAILVNGTSRTGGLVGNVRHKDAPFTAENCWFNGSVTGVDWIGGIIGFVHGTVAYTNLTDCLVTADLTSTMESGKCFIGGLSGRATAGKFTSCAVVGKLTGPIVVCGFVGLAVTQPTQTFEITQCYNVTNVKTYYNSALQRPSLVQVKNMNADELTGTNGYFNTLLSFYDKNTNKAGRWVLIENALPELKSFTVAQFKSDLSDYIITDTSWYNENQSEFTITTAGQLYGLAQLSNQDGLTFAGKTIKLGADIRVNSGESTDWAQGKNLPFNTWTPIGNDTDNNFAGTFDGQGHTISGLYLKSDAFYLGLFGVLDIKGGSIVKNLKITNSYFECTNTTPNPGEINGLGSVAGQGAGTIDTIYSDVILVNGNGRTGGIIGNHRQKNTTLNMTNCWYDGDMTGTDWMGGMVGFIHGSVTGTNLTDCLVTSDITSTLETGKAFIGGFLGRATAGSINSCVVVGDLTGPGVVNGFIGLSVTQSTQSLTIENTYNVTNQTKQYETGLGTPSVTQVRNLSEKQIKGTQGYCNTLLSFYDKNTNPTGKWALVKNELPELKSFAQSGYVDDLTELGELARPVVADTTWYDENLDEFTITTAGQLYGFAQLSNKDRLKFTGKTIKLGADIKVNNGFATDWAEGNNLPINTWTPIGTDTDWSFAGTFDGQGHSISGLYLKSDGLYLGLFGVLDIKGGSTVKNLELVNSYFECTNTAINGAEINGLGSIAGQGAGILDTIYSDVILVNGTGRTGGMIGNHRQPNTTLSVTNCWVDGNITGTDWIGGIIGFVHGGVAGTYVKDCLVTADLSGTSNIGGISGRVNGGSFDSCVYKGTITGTSNANGILGNGVTLINTNPDNRFVMTKCYYVSNATKSHTHVTSAGLAIAPTVSHVSKMNESDLQGKAAYTNTDLDFYVKDNNEDGRWVAIKNNGLLELKSFALEDMIDDVSNENRPIEPDMTWYDANKNEYVICTADELYGLAKLCNEAGHLDTAAKRKFTDKTIKLGSDIKVNYGLAGEWAKGEEPNNKWVPIGTDTGWSFAGIFDGQGHTISGIYLKSDSYYLGLFGVLDTNGKATIKNLKLTNSYLECTATSRPGEVHGLGSIAGQGCGTLETVYSNAMLVNGSTNTGGLVGSVVQNGVTLDVKNCWYDGNVTGTAKDTTSSYDWVGGIVGFVGVNSPTVNMTDCLVTADLTSKSTKSDVVSFVGGLSGRSMGGTIKSCVVVGTLKVNRGYVRSIVGMNIKNTLSIEQCYNATNTTSHYYNVAPSKVEVTNTSADQLKDRIAELSRVHLSTAK